MKTLPWHDLFLWDQKIGLESWGEFWFSCVMPLARCRSYPWTIKAVRRILVHETANEEELTYAKPWCAKETASNLAAIVSKYKCTWLNERQDDLWVEKKSQRQSIVDIEYSRLCTEKCNCHRSLVYWSWTDAQKQFRELTAVNTIAVEPVHRKSERCQQGQYNKSYNWTTVVKTFYQIRQQHLYNFSK